MGPVMRPTVNRTTRFTASGEKIHKIAEETIKN